MKLGKQIPFSTFEPPVQKSSISPWEVMQPVNVQARVTCGRIFFFYSVLRPFEDIFTHMRQANQKAEEKNSTTLQT